jgi:preprotein translocase subunit SecE
VAEKTKVTRIKASDNTPKAAKPANTGAKTAKAAPAKAAAVAEPRKNIFSRIGGYFKGAWIELRQVRWPNRRATWGLTLAVILFSLFFVVLIVLLDTFFQYVFELIIT